MFALVTTPVIDLTTSDSDDEGTSSADLSSRATQSTHSAKTVAHPHLTQQSPYQPTREVTTPSKPSTASASATGICQDTSPRSTRLSQPHDQDASPRSAFVGFVVGNGSASNMVTYDSPTSRGRWNSADPMAQNSITPKRSATRRDETFNVDKLASQLKSFATEIDKANARLVYYTIREVIKKPLEQRHLSAVDEFADMPSIAEEPGSVSEGSLRVQFKVRDIDIVTAKNTS